jgi:hypothetical protein
VGQSAAHGPSACFESARQARIVVSDRRLHPLAWSNRRQQDLQDIIRARDLSGFQTEFNRIYENLEADPSAAVTASCALLESLFIYTVNLR